MIEAIKHLLVVMEITTHLASVHDEGTVLHDGLVSGLPADQDEVRRRGESLYQNS